MQEFPQQFCQDRLDPLDLLGREDPLDLEDPLGREDPLDRLVHLEVNLRLEETIRTVGDVVGCADCRQLK